MSQKVAIVVLGVLLISMVTGAPTASRVDTESVDESESAVDRAKRADEMMIFGNQQNKARVMNKRADLDDLEELDKGSEVIVHKETPVEKDLAERADAARKDFEDQDKIADAMEAAMESVDNMADEREQPEQESVPKPALADQMSGEAGEAADDISNPHSVEAGEEAQEVGEGAAGEDADIKDLLQVTGDIANEEQAVEPQAASEESSKQTAQEEDDSDQEEQYPQTSEVEAAPVASVVDPDLSLEGPSEANPQELGDFWRQMYQYMETYPGNARIPFDLYRRRRSLMSSKRAGSRRIKRDLLDDVEYDPAWLRYLYANSDDGMDTPTDDQFEAPANSVLDMGDSLLADEDGYVPLTDSDAEDLYNELEEYLQWELQRRAGAEKLRETLGLAPSDDLENGDLSSFYGGEADGGEDGAGESNLLADNSQLSYPYGAEYPSDNGYYFTSKRSSSGSKLYELPTEETEKRYFFPFADEPETHWGAFVPEKREIDAGDERGAYLDDPYLDDYRSPSKRDYNEAIQRLQRLAMALSDNRGPYYTEMVQDQPYKK